MRLPGDHAAFCGGELCANGTYGPDDVVSPGNLVITGHVTPAQGVVEIIARFAPAVRGDGPVPGPESETIVVEYGLATNPEAAEHARGIAIDPQGPARVGFAACTHIRDCTGAAACPFGEAGLASIIAKTNV